MVTENSVRSENTEVPIIREFIVATTMFLILRCVARRGGILLASCRPKGFKRERLTLVKHTNRSEEGQGRYIL